MLRACLLAIIAGFADTVGFMHYQAFAGLMTGNTIMIGIEVATGKLSEALFHAAIIGIFLLGVIVSRVILRYGKAPWVALTTAGGLLVVCGFLGNTAAALMLALAMGMQNSAANRFNGVALNTVFNTGNLQKIGEGLVAWAWPPPGAAAKAGDGVAIFAWVWFGYAAGAVLGAFGVLHLRYPLLLPALLLPFVMLDKSHLQDLSARFRLEKT